MENTSRTSLHALTGRKVIQTAILIAFAGLVCRTPLAGEFFPAAAAVTAATMAAAAAVEAAVAAAAVAAGLR